MGLEVYDVTTVASAQDLELSKNLRGRRRIFSSVDEVTDANVIDVLTKALPIHVLNRREEIFLKKYVRGQQPILLRTKTYNDHINNKVVVNIANQIVTFKASEFAGEPIMYVSRGSGIRDQEGEEEEQEDSKVPGLVAAVNSMMLSEGKQTKDLKLANEMFTCGVGYRLVIHDSGRPNEEYLDEAPFEMYVLDSENTFVVRRNDYSKRVLMGVTYVYKGENFTNPEYTVYTPNVKYTISGVEGAMEIVDREKHNFGMVNIIEYPCNPMYMGAFEPVVPLLDSINLTLSNKLDGIEQFIQALMVFDGVDISREDFLELKDLGAIKIPATQGGGNGGKKLYYLNEQLDQSQTQTVIDSMYKHIMHIVGMPIQGDGNTSDSSNNGAVIMKNGWWDAEARMQETQGMWKEAETDFLKVVLKICAQTNKLEGLKISDLEPRFWRQSYEDLLVKTQSFSTLRTSGMPAIQAFTFSHLSRDPESDALVYDEYQAKLAAELDRLNGVGEGLPLDEDDTVNPTSEEGVEAQAGADEGAKPAGESKEGQWAICPVCGKRFKKKETNQVYDSISCANKARRDNGIGFRR